MLRSPPKRTGSGSVPDLMAQLQEAEIRLRLREAREHAGLSRRRLADILTVHDKSIENYEKERVPWALVNRWAEVTGVTVQWLLHGEDEPKDALTEQLDRIERTLHRIERNLQPAGAEDVADELPAEGSPRAARDAP